MKNLLEIEFYMLSFEKKVCQYIRQNMHIFYFAIISLLGLAVRVSGFSFLSGDMKNCLLPWFDMIREAKCRYTIGDYNLLYQSIIYGMTHIPINPVYQYKIVSVFFDFALAIIVANFSCAIANRSKKSLTFLFAYSVVLFLPTVFLNSGFWGQCDSIYVFFVVSALYFLYTGKIKTSFSMLGLAFAFKLQTIFILPFYIFYYFQEQKFSIFNFFITFFIFLLSGLLFYMRGMSIFTPITVYFNQVGEFNDHLYLNIHSAWLTLGNVVSLKGAAIIVTAAILGGG